MKDIDIDKAQRVQQSLTSAWEKRNLPRMAKAMPRWVTPDHMTVLGLVAALLIAAGYVLAHLSSWWILLSVASLGLHWLGDSLDGTLARVRKKERERYGYYVDRTADAISTVVICLGLGLSPFVTFSVALLLGISYLLMQIYAEIRAYTSRTFQLSFGRFGPTEARIALGAFSLALIAYQPRELAILGTKLLALDLVLLAISGGLFLLFVKSSLTEAKRLDRLDRARWLTASGAHQSAVGS